MDFLESLDFDEKHKKCHRVRSWYLYEQYKSLEKNQLDATQKLKNKSYQEKILKQELKERRARRRLCDDFGSCHSESRLEKTIQNAPSKAPLSVTDDLFESFCELHEENDLDDFAEQSSQDGSRTSKNFDVFRIVGNEKEDSDEESANSVIKNVTHDENMTDDIRNELDMVKKNIADNINLQLETVKENIDCLERFTKLGDDDKISEVDLFEQCETDVSVSKARTKFTPKTEKFLTTWSKLVTFAYKTVQLNHGNFYNDYSSQLMIAVLICDVLRRGINKICHILQPYVSPIKYVTSDSDICEENYNGFNRKKSICCKRYPTSHKNAKHNSQNSIKSCRKLHWLLDREYQSEKKWQRYSKHNFDNSFNEMKLRGASEPWRSVPKFECGKRSSGKCSSLCPQEFTRDKFSEKNICECPCLKNVANPILQLARYIENILQDIES